VGLVDVEHLGEVGGVLVDHLRVRGAAEHGLDEELEDERGDGRVEVVRLDFQPRLQLRRRRRDEVRPLRLVLGGDVPVDGAGLCRRKLQGMLVNLGDWLSILSSAFRARLATLLRNRSD
jgi:hypothetical protein